ncbi:hypothetical protein Nepgr_019548 [Nepenthes gracilis]|uniref:phosphatidate phosphatase n=1 Tax=Nepenthes gracilis TaxID=150966 RepID=A0AAD3SV78_NEPGR|nr:hypothetical protein Nepgr_019548 [Nepenthes gracilis]
MYAVGRLGSYLTRGVYTVSGPFHPFGGAVDIIVVEQHDGSFKSSPWYVRFGKFQGVLKAKEKVVTINVNGADTDLHMYLDHKGQAYFLREADGEGVTKTYPSSSGDEEDGKSNIMMLKKPVNYDFDASNADLVSCTEANNGKIVARTSSTRPRGLGLVFGRRLVKKNGLQDDESIAEMGRASSLERAEIAADLLDVRWSTNLATSRHWKDDASSAFDRKSFACETDGIEYKVVGNQAVDWSMEETDGRCPLSTSPMNYMETFTLEETYLDLEVNLISKGSRCSNNVDNASDHFDNSKDEKSGIFSSNSNSSHSMELEPTVGRLSDGELNSNAKFALHDGNISECGGRSDSVQFCVNSEATENSVGGLDASSKKTNDALDFAASSSRELQFHAQNFYELMNQLSEVNSEPRSSMPSMDKNVGSLEHLNERKSPEGSKQCEGEKTSLSSTKNRTVPETVAAKIVTELDALHRFEMTENPAMDIDLLKEVVKEASADQGLDLNSSSIILGSHSAVLSSIDEVRSDGPCTTSGSLNSLHPVLDKENLAGDMSDRSSSSSERGCNGDDLQRVVVSEEPSRSLEEELLPFSDLSNSKFPEVQYLESASSDPVGNIYHPCNFPGSNKKEKNESTSTHNESYSFTEKFIQEDQLDGYPRQVEKLKRKSSPISISNVPIQADQESLAHFPFKGSQISEDLKRIVSDPAVELSLCRHVLYEGMGYEAAAHAFDAEKLDVDKFASLGPDIIKNERLVVRIGGLYFPWFAALPIASAIGSNGTEQILEPKGMIVVDAVEKAGEGDPQRFSDSKNANWRFWPFSFRRSKSLKSRQPDLENPCECSKGMAWDAAMNAPKVNRKKIRAITPTSEQLASLNLKEGKNVVTFTFSTAMLGDQQVDARIYLWKWNTRIVISDVDGTITKSDVLGQFMPLVGIDWSQTGVAHFYSAIKENGYQLLFLSARAISQAYHTRQFLFNLKQDGKALPEGPVVISPDGLFPSLYREVIRRAPHEFKISCLEEIKALFPPDSNPFYAGFGNRDTDEISYLKVGIPKGKIFTINPKGQIVVNQQVDRKSYTSLHALVNDMFPPTSSNEQEDFNSWNYWKLPPAGLGI